MIKIFFIKNTKIIFIIELKKYVNRVYYFDIIISKFYYKKELYLFILSKINKSLKISFYCTIWLFSLAIYLKIKDSEKFLLNSKEIIY